MIRFRVGRRRNNKPKCTEYIGCNYIMGFFLSVDNFSIWNRPLRITNVRVNSGEQFRPVGPLRSVFFFIFFYCPLYYHVKKNSLPQKRLTSSGDNFQRFRWREGWRWGGVVRLYLLRPCLRPLSCCIVFVNFLITD